MLAPDAAPAEIRDAAAAMLADKVLRSNCRAFAACVRRFGDLPRAADLVMEGARVAK